MITHVELAKQLEISRMYLYTITRKNKLGNRIGKHVYYTKQEYDTIIRIVEEDERADTLVVKEYIHYFQPIKITLLCKILRENVGMNNKKVRKYVANLTYMDSNLLEDDSGNLFYLSGLKR